MENVQIQLIDLSAIEPDPNQPRAVDPEHVVSLATSFEATGKENALFANPIKIRQNGSPDSFVIVNGHHRHGAYLLNDYEKIPAIITEETDDMEIFEDQILDNFNRLQMGLMEIARSFLKSQDSRNSIAEIAAKVGKDEKFVEEHLALNNLPTDLQKLVENGDMYGSIGKELGTVGDHKAIQKMWKHIRRFKKASDQKKALEAKMTTTTQETVTPEPEAQVSKKKCKTRFDNFNTAVSGFKQFLTSNRETMMGALMKRHSATVESLAQDLRTLADSVDSSRKGYLEKTNATNIE